MPRGAKPAFTPAQDVAIATRYKAGETIRGIAASYGVSHVPVLAALRRCDVPRRTSKDYGWHETAESRAEIVSLFDGGLSVNGIAKRVGTRSPNVSRVLAASGRKARLGGVHRRFSDEQVAVLVREHGEGASLAALARKHGGNVVTVRGALHRAGVESTHRKRQAFWTPERMDWLAEQYRAGRSEASLAAEVGLSQTAVGGRLRKLGVVPRRKAARAAQHGRWGGGRRIDAKGYVHLLLANGDPFASMRMQNGYVTEHRLVMAQALGRSLSSGEQVHHIDGDRQNNELSNLQLRTGPHGNGITLACRTCGSSDVGPTPLGLT